jgi:hypothetical protein
MLLIVMSKKKKEERIFEEHIALPIILVWISGCYLALEEIPDVLKQCRIVLPFHFIHLDSY